MARDPFPDVTGLHNPFDPDPGDDGDLWFLPDDAPDDDLPPLPRAERRGLFDAGDWRAAQGICAAALARVAALAGALDERLRHAAPGLRHRLALAEAADLSWWVGDRISADRLALHDSLRLSSASDAAQAVGRAHWAVRRLSSGLAPAQDWTGFLGRAGDDIDDLAALAQDLSDLHPIPRGAVLFQAWRMMADGESPARNIEAAVLAARISAEGLRGGLVFLPLALTGFSGLRVSGTPAEKLAQWLAGAERACLAALLLLDRLADWQAKAEAALSDLQGRTPILLLRVLADWPMVDAPMAEKLTKAGRATVQRNLDLMTARGLLREVTGQGRYRLWSARLG